MLAATLLALGSAVIHASWNLLIKTSDDRAVAAWGQFTAAALAALVGLAVVGGPGWQAAPYLAASAVVHVAYIEGLVGAYTRGDFSLSYPLARGGGAVLAAVGSAVVLDDRLPVLGWIGVAVAGVGLAALRGRGVPAADDVVLGADIDAPHEGPRDVPGGAGGADVEAPHEGPRDVPGGAGGADADAPRDAPGPVARAAGGAERAALAFALLTAVCIATYTIIDSAGSRAGASGVAYGLASCAASGAAVCGVNLLRPARRARLRPLLAGWRRHLAGGLGTVVAYTTVLVAVRRAPVGYVSMLRESSVVLGALFGWLVLREGLGGRRLVASIVILAGLVLLVIAGG